MSEDVLIEVAPGDGVIALFVLRKHVREEHLQLLLRDGAVGGIGGEMEVVEHQLPLPYAEALDAVAPVQVHQLHEALLNGQLPPESGCYGELGEGSLSGPVGPVGRQEGPKEVGAVVILGEGAVEVSGLTAHQGPLVLMVAAGAVHVHLLEEEEVRVQLLQGLDRAGDVLHHRLRGAGAALRAAVHEEAVVAAVGPEADVVGGRTVAPPGLQGAVYAVVVEGLHLQGEVVVQAVPGEEDVGRVASHGQDQHQQDCQQNSDCLFQPGVRSFPVISETSILQTKVLLRMGGA